MSLRLEEFSRLFFWGFEGPAMTVDLQKAFKSIPPCGVILFRRNITSVDQVMRLNAALKKQSRSPLWIGVDEEGGRVRRLPYPFPEFPPAATWGVWARKSGSLKILKDAGYLLGGSLKEVGFNLDFAPVLDVHSNPLNPIIGNRAFSTSPQEVAKFALAFHEGMTRSGIQTCGKHFPGHGDTFQDSHLELPVVKRSRATLNKVELFPFKQLILKGISMLMTAHVVYPEWDKKNPATFSHKILYDILIKIMKYKGIIISDDLMMKAVAKDYDLATSSLLALEAGVDIPLICEGMEKGEGIVEKVYREVSKSPVLLEKAKSALHKISHFQKKLV